ncbi:cupin domain-containing protein 8 [Elsinoe australis]|uniref:Cupin domain-containing protein 8 n=1 Tax=Elsinoe australis TaxID=40998 RepID=A0A4U7ANJ8_9PEZI|nr:cupin domain-containing protein 8 [Elsinoe australis]
MAASELVYVPSPDRTAASGGQTSGMTRTNAISGQASINASMMTAAPRTKSGVHHHGEQDTIIYALTPGGSVLTEGGKKRVDLGQGDFCLIPKGVEHQEVNDSDQEVVWVITRSGDSANVVNVDNWQN